jgi:hypothetical protein
MRRNAQVDVTLSEFQGVRYLHFGSEWVQGAMRLSRPDELVLSYVRQMMAGRSSWRRPTGRCSWGLARAR